MQKKFTLVFLLVLCWRGYEANAQSVGINNSGSPAHASAILDVQATNRGMLVPRMTAAQRAAIASPATGLLVYQTDAPAGFQFYNGTAWVPVSTTGWTLTGNAASAADFVGTTNNEPLRLRANNQEHARLTQRGGLELGMNTFNNLFIGQGAGAATDLMNASVQNSPNTFIGHQAGLANTTGFSNYFVGFQAGRANNTGSLNHFIGIEAGLSNTTASRNTFMGYQAGRRNSTGENNHFVGYQAGLNNTTGNSNTFIGVQAGLSNTIAINNHFVGFQTGFNTTTGINNTFMGVQSGFANQTGSGNVFLGFQAGRNLTNPGNQLVIANNGTNSLITGNFITGQVGINTNGTTEASAALEVRATDKGMLVPRMTAAQRAAIATPATGLLVYQTDAPAGFQFYNGTSWVMLSSGASGWTLTGNPGTDTDFLGTTTNQPLRLRANNQEHARLTQRGGLELGMNAFNNLFIGQGAGAATDLTVANVRDFPNTFIGHQAGLNNTTGIGNHFVGFQAGLNNTTGNGNHFAGFQAGFTNNTGDNNHFVGLQAGFFNTSSNNHFVGIQAGYANTTGTSNHFTGLAAGYNNTTGNNNTFMGLQAGLSNTTGFNNHFVGLMAGRNNTTGNSNHFVGYQAGFNNTTGNNNTFMGLAVGRSNTTGNNNTFMGFQSGLGNETGSGNVFLGFLAGRNLTNPSNLLVIANNAVNSLITGNFTAGQVGINTNGTTEATAALEVRATDKGMLVPRMTAAQRDAIATPATGLLVYQTDAPAGFQFYNGTSWLMLSSSASGWALAGNASTATDFLGTTTNQPLRLRANNQEHARLTQRGGLELGMNTFNNLFIGRGAGAATDLTNVNVREVPNTFIGHRAGEFNTIGYGNHFVGHYAGSFNTTGSLNTFIGDLAGEVNTTGSVNHFVGFYAGKSNTIGNRNHFAGYHSGLMNTTGSDNIFIGQFAGRNNTTGTINTFIGFEAGRSNTTANENTFIGFQAGRTNNTGVRNHFLGFQAGFNNTTGGDNTFMGFQSGLVNQTGSGNVFLGFHAGRNLTNPSNQLVIANNATTSLITGNFSNGQVFNQNNSASWNTTSDRRIKQNIMPVEGALATLMRVRPVRYEFTPEWVKGHPGLGGRVFLGVIAQEYREVFPNDVMATGETLPGDANPVLGVDMGSAQIITIKAVQELAAEVEALKKQNASLQEKLNELLKLMPTSGNK